MMSELVCFLSKFLDTDELDKQAENDTTDISPHYLGCYPADVNPKNITENCCWIWNVDEKDKPGSYWVAVIKDKAIIYFFDSYGKTPFWFKRHYWVVKCIYIIHHKFSRILVELAEVGACYF